LVWYALFTNIYIQWISQLSLDMDLGGVTGIKIIQDTGVLSDHNMIISKIDLGIEKFKISTEKEERFEFRRIMNIPVVLKQGHDHPTFNEQVFMEQIFFTIKIYT
jgi:hypothetical protein